MIFKGVKSLQAQTTQETILLAVRDAVIAAKILGYKQLIFLRQQGHCVEVNYKQLFVCSWLIVFVFCSLVIVIPQNLV